MQNGRIKYHKRMRLNRAWLVYFPFQRQRIADGIALIFNELKTMPLHPLCQRVCVCACSVHEHDPLMSTLFVYRLKVNVFYFVLAIVKNLICK